jgi:hypothetical protein
VEWRADEGGDVSGHAEYFALQAINWSKLKAMRVSPLHFLHAMESTIPDSPAMRLGRACHTAVLEPDVMPLDFTVWEHARRGKDWTEFAEVNAAKTILTVDEYDTALRIRDAVHANHDAAKLLRGCQFEQTVTWTDKATDLPCKCRPDAMKPYKVIDLKTTRSVDARKFGRLAYDMGYFGQGAFYAEGVKKSVPRRRRDWDFYMIVVESEPPHDCGVFKVDDDSLYASTLDVRALLDKAAYCLHKDEWPGRYHQVQTLSLPPWEFVDDGTMALEGLIPKGTR